MTGPDQDVDRIDGGGVDPDPDLSMTSSASGPPKARTPTAFMRWPE
jgi:hypothetical protein